MIVCQFISSFLAQISAQGFVAQLKHCDGITALSCFMEQSAPLSHLFTSNLAPNGV